jgi:DNA-binding CsgD family transcriptional regulator
VGGLLERDPEVQTIEEALDAATGGEGRLVLVEAPAGLGKSSLLEAARERARDRGFEVLAARGRDLEREFPFGVARQLFEGRLRAGDAAERRRLLEGSAGLAGELLGVDGPAGSAAPGDPSPYPLLHALHWVAANLAERAPLLIVVDDAHWADELSLRFVGYLGARLGDLPIVVMAALRPGEGSADTPLLVRLAAEPAARTLRPGPLSEAASARLVAMRAPGVEPAFAAACYQATGGNPFLLGELLAALAQGGVAPVAASVPRVREIAPEPVARAVELTLRALSPEATAVARAVAVLGDGAPPSQIAALAKLSGDAAEQAIGALRTAGILDPRDVGVGFAHPILGRAIYEELDPAERAAAHRAAVSVLHAAGTPAERVAAHALKAGAGTGSEAVAALRAAASDAVRRGAPRPAARYLRRALEEPPAPDQRSDVLADLGRAEAAAGEPGAVDRLREAMAAMAGAPERRAALAGELGSLLQARGAFAEAAATFDDALAEIGPGSTPLHLSLEAGRASAALWTRTPAPEIRARVERLVDPSGRPETRAERALLADLAALEMLSGDDRHGAIAWARRAWGGGALLARGGLAGPGIWATAVAFAGCEAWDDLAAMLDLVADAAREAGAVLTCATAGYLRAYRWMCLGAVDDALAEVDRTLDARRFGWGAFAPAALWVRARCLIERGDVDAAEATVDVPAEEEVRFAGSPLALVMLDARARVLLARNRPAAALSLWRQAGVIAAATSVRNPSLVCWRSGAAMAAGRMGEGEEARRLADDAVAAARAFGGSRSIGVALTARGTVERPRAALPWLEEAVAVLEHSPARLELARALVQLGTARRVAGRRTDAREPLRRGLDLADRCGATVLAGRAREELVAAGGRPRRTRMWGAEALTPSERRVAGLVASGMSNREAAEALFVTKKAVEFHLANVYRKLGIHRRDQLSEALGDAAGGEP